MTTPLIIGSKVPSWQVERILKHIRRQNRIEATLKTIALSLFIDFVFVLGMYMGSGI